MSYVTGISGNVISAASAGFAPTNSADVSAIASVYSESAASGKLDTTAQVVTSTGSASAMMMGGTSYYVSQINGLNISAQKADVADEWMHAGDKLDTTAFNSSEFYSTSNPSGFVDSAYVESAISGKQDTLSFGYDDDKISAINGSALAGQGGGMITSIESSLDPWYQTAISGLNGSSLYASWALSAADAGMAYHATTATSAGYAESAGAAPTAWASSFITGVASPSGTIRVLGGTSVEATNSALLPSTVTAGFTSVGGTTESTNTTSFTLPVSNPNTHVHFSGGWSDGTFAVNTDNGIYTSEPSYGYIDVEFDLPYATSITATYNWVSELSYTASASAHEEGGGVGELAWASAIPTYQYDSENKISSINGSAIAGGAGGVDSATCSAIASSYAESAVSSKADSSALSSYALSADVSGTVDLVSTQSANWGGSALALSAGPGVKLEKVGDTLVASTDETVLWSGSCLTQGGAAATLSEAASNFEKIEIHAIPNPSTTYVNPQIFTYPGSNTAGAYLCPFMTTGLKGKFSCGLWTITNGTSFNLIAAGQTDSYPSQNWDNSYGGVVKVVGINRTAEA